MFNTISHEQLDKHIIIKCTQHSYKYIQEDRAPARAKDGCALKRFNIYSTRSFITGQYKAMMYFMDH